MKVIICGIGRVGLSIASYLSMQDHQITIIDADAQLVKRVSDTYDIAGIVGHASQPDILKQAGAEDAEIIIAVTDCDEVNMVACQIAHTVFGIHKKIARIRNKEYREPAWSNLFSRNHMPIDVIISPEEEIADAILKRMSVPGTTNDINIADDNVHIFGMIIDEDNALCEETIRNMYYIHKGFEFRVVTIIRDGKSQSFDDQTVIKEGDEIYFVCAKSILMKLLEALGHKTNIYSGNIIISGGGVIGEAICSKIKEEPVLGKNDLILIDQNIQRARHLNRIIKDALIINGSALDYDILKEARTEKAAVYVSVMNSNENNILSAMLAKKMGAKYSIALSTNKLYGQLLPDRFIDAIVNPEVITVSRILHILRRGNIRAIHAIRDTKTEIIEAEVTGECAITNTPLADLKLHDNVKVLSIYRPSENSVILPTGQTIVKPGDVVSILSNNVSVREIERLFSFAINLF